MPCSKCTESKSICQCHGKKDFVSGMGRIGAAVGRGIGHVGTFAGRQAIKHPPLALAAVGAPAISYAASRTPKRPTPMPPGDKRFGQKGLTAMLLANALRFAGVQCTINSAGNDVVITGFDPERLKQIVGLLKRVAHEVWVVGQQIFAKNLMPWHVKALEMHMKGGPTQFASEQGMHHAMRPHTVGEKISHVAGAAARRAGKIKNEITGNTMTPGSGAIGKIREGAGRAANAVHQGGRRAAASTQNAVRKVAKHPGATASKIASGVSRAASNIPKASRAVVETALRHPKIYGGAFGVGAVGGAGLGYMMNRDKKPKKGKALPFKPAFNPAMRRREMAISAGLGLATTAGMGYLMGRNTAHDLNRGDRQTRELKEVRKRKAFEKKPGSLGKETALHAAAGAAYGGITGAITGRLGRRTGRGALVGAAQGAAAGGVVALATHGRRAMEDNEHKKEVRRLTQLRDLRQLKASTGKKSIGGVAEVIGHGVASGVRKAGHAIQGAGVRAARKMPNVVGRTVERAAMPAGRAVLRAGRAMANHPKTTGGAAMGAAGAAYGGVLYGAHKVDTALQAGRARKVGRAFAEGAAEAKKPKKGSKGFARTVAAHTAVGAGLGASVGQRHGTGGHRGRNAAIGAGIGGAIGAATGVAHATTNKIADAAVNRLKKKIHQETAPKEGEKNIWGSAAKESVSKVASQAGRHIAAHVGELGSRVGEQIHRGTGRQIQRAAVAMGKHPRATAGAAAGVAATGVGGAGFAAGRASKKKQLQGVGLKMDLAPIGREVARGIQKYGGKVAAAVAGSKPALQTGVRKGGKIVVAIHHVPNTSGFRGAAGTHIRNAATGLGQAAFRNPRTTAAVAGGAALGVGAGSAAATTRALNKKQLPNQEQKYTLNEVGVGLASGATGYMIGKYRGRKLATRVGEQIHTGGTSKKKLFYNNEVGVGLVTGAAGYMIGKRRGRKLAAQQKFLPKEVKSLVVNTNTQIEQIGRLAQCLNKVAKLIG